MSQSAVVVTGAAGFIGAALVERLLADPQLSPKDILGVDEDSLFQARSCSSRFAPQISTLSVEAFTSALSRGDCKPSVIFHLGASSSTEEMREDYLKRVNEEYSKTLWNFCQIENIPFFYASSGATYGAGEHGFSDDPTKLSLCKPLNPYGRSKHRFDLFVQSQVASGQGPSRWAGFKFFNVYGPGEEHKGSQASVVWHAAKQVAQTGALKLFESHRPGLAHGHQQRDFGYVEDLVDVLLAFWKSPDLKSGLYNVGTGAARTFLDLASAVFRVLKKPEKIDFIPTPQRLREHYQYYTQAELTRLRTAGFRAPFTSLEVGVEKTLQEMKKIGKL